MFYIPTHQLKAAIQCAAKKDIRYYLQGVLIECTQSGDVHIVSTDGHVMFAGLIASANVNHSDNVQNGPYQIIVPLDAAKQACKTKAGMIKLDSIPDGRYTLGDVVFTAVDGRFPDWRRVSPSHSVIATRPSSPSIFDCELLARCQDAMREWHHAPKAFFKIQQSENQAAVMQGRDCTAYCVIMPIRDNTVTTADHFTPCAYGVKE